jgi:hypothetical protein
VTFTAQMPGSGMVNSLTCQSPSPRSAACRSRARWDGDGVSSRRSHLLYRENRKILAHYANRRLDAPARPGVIVTSAMASGAWM